MPKFIRDVVIFCGINTLVLGFMYAIYDPSTDYFAAVNDKLDRSAVTEPPRIIFIGGSSVAWSNHSQVIKDQFPEYGVENLAYHAGLGLGLRINEARELSREGDVVVISIEWGIYSDEPTPRIMAEAVVACPRILALMDSRDWKIACDGFLPALKMPVASFINVAKCKKLKAFTHEAAQSRKRFRLRKNFNELGDFQGHYKEISPGIAGKYVDFPSEEKLLDGIARLNDLNDELAERGVRLIYFIPIIAEQGYAMEKKKTDEYVKLLTEKLEFPILNKTEYVYPTDAYFDSCYHMKGEAGLRRTKMLAAKLSEVIDPTPLATSR